MQLLRPKDGAVSEPREFYYRPDPYTACRKRARPNDFGKLLLIIYTFTITMSRNLEEQIVSNDTWRFDINVKSVVIWGAKINL